MKHEWHRQFVSCLDQPLCGFACRDKAFAAGENDPLDPGEPRLRQPSPVLLFSVSTAVVVDVDEDQVERHGRRGRETRIVEDLTENNDQTAWFENLKEIVEGLRCRLWRQDLEESPQDSHIIGPRQRASHGVASDHLGPLGHALFFDEALRNRRNGWNFQHSDAELGTNSRDSHRKAARPAADI